MEPGETVSFTKCYKKSLPLFFFFVLIFIFYMMLILIETSFLGQGELSIIRDL